MAITAITFLSEIAILLLIGLIGSAVADKLKISNVLILLVLGLVMGKLFGGLFSFQEVFLVALAILTLAIVVFEGTSKLSYRQLDQYSGPSIRLTFWQLLFALILVGSASYFLFFSKSPVGALFAIILAVSLAGTDPSSVLLMVTNGSAKVIQLLTLEAVLNTPFVVVIPFIIIDILQGSLGLGVIWDISQQVVTGIGTGVMLGIILFKTLRRYYVETISTVAVIAAALLAYILAENLGGSGVLAVATMGILFGNFNIKKKEELQNFSIAFSNVLEILIFLLIGIIIGDKLPLTLTFLFSTLALFILLILGRAASVYITLRSEYEFKDMIFIAITMPKGIAVAVLIFSYALVPEIPPIILPVLFALTIYSVITATIASYWYSHVSLPPKRRSH